MPVRLYDRDDPRYSNWTPSRPPRDGPPLRRATDDDPPLDASHATRYNARNYGFAPSAHAPAVLGDRAIVDDGEQRADAEPAVRRRSWRPWPRRGQSRKAREETSTPADPA